MDRRKGLKAGIGKLGPVNRFLFWGFVVVLGLTVLFFVIQMLVGATKGGQKAATIDRDKKHTAAQLDRDAKHEREMKTLSDIDSKLESEINQTPDINFEPFGWRQVKTLSADYGLKAAFIVNNGGISVKDLHLSDEYYISVEGFSDIQKYLSKASETFNREQEDTIVSYHKNVLEICKRVTQIVADSYYPDMPSTDMQMQLYKKGIKAHVYGQEKEYYFAPMILRSNEKHSYEYGRSTGQEWIEGAILDRGTNLLIIVSILEYRDEKENLYRSFLISRSGIERNNYFKTLQGVLYYPLVEFKEWYTEIE